MNGQDIRRSQSGRATHAALLAALAWLAAALAQPAMAVAQDRDHDHDRARELYQHGAIKALADILPVVHAAAPGQVVAVDLIQMGKIWVYRFQVIAVDGARTSLDIDAATAVIIPAGGATPRPGGGAG